jgi:hypothetical protein
LFRGNPFILIFFPGAYLVFTFIIQWILLVTVGLLNGLVTVVTYLVCSLASLFVGLKGFQTYLEIYHAKKAFEKLRRRQ